jgi:hypothetical protein
MRARVVGLGRFELPTSRLSGVRSNQLSYRPKALIQPVPWKLSRDVFVNEKSRLGLWTAYQTPKIPTGPVILIKEVIQPQVLLQLPCYDFTPITDHTMGSCLPCGLAHRLPVQPTFVM